MPKVLVVDDELATRRLVMYTLKSLDIEVLGAEDAREALAICESQDVDLVMVDINLPVMDGFTLIKHLNTLKRMENVPIITFTARSHPDDETRARALGAKGFIYKPFSTTELRTLIRQHIPAS